MSDSELPLLLPSYLWAGWAASGRLGPKLNWAARSTRRRSGQHLGLGDTLPPRSASPDAGLVLSRIFFTYGHRNVVRAIASGLADSGSIDGYVWDVMSQREPQLVAKTRVITRFDFAGVDGHWNVATWA
jgi:hypothetical protein